ncbi:MAG: TrkA family potassium uptake protein [Candidatus Omnitrophica bacterium]|nr:TrkA family potassium uptake protein [Candidatus Omnitrophota bacterium]
MKYILIIGCGKSGKGLALDLSRSENVVVVDKSLRSLDTLGDDFNGKKIWADAMDTTTLEKAGVKEADIVFLLTGNDNLNLVVSKVVRRKYGVRQVILQVNDSTKEKIFQEEGLEIINRTSLMVEVLRGFIS